MKNNEIIQIAAMVVIAAALIYRKYFKKKTPVDKTTARMPGRSIFSSDQTDEQYEPYSKKNINK